MNFIDSINDIGTYQIIHYTTKCLHVKYGSGVILVGNQLIKLNY